MPAGGGWWKFHRQAFESELKPTLREPACRLAAFAWIVGEAKHTPEDGLKRGEIRLSERRPAEVMWWPRPRAQRFLKWLVERSMLRSVERSTQGTVFVVVSYRKFQDPKNERSTERSGERSNTKNKKKGRRFNGVAETSKSEGGADRCLACGADRYTAL